MITASCIACKQVEDGLTHYAVRLKLIMHSAKHALDAPGDTNWDRLLTPIENSWDKPVDYCQGCGSTTKPMLTNSKCYGCYDDERGEDY